MTTSFYPDVSSDQAGMSLAGAAAVCVKITQGTGYVNPSASAFKAQADAAGAFLFAYHFLTEGDPAGQAGWCYDRNGPRVALMVDCEPDPEIGSYPKLADLTGFVDAYRSHGGTVNLAYLPRWYWGDLGSPSLAPLADRRLKLVSSDYTAYSDTGPGWAPYGGLSPVIWQYTAGAVMNGRVVDRNAFRGTIAQLAELVTTGSVTVTPKRPADDVEDDPMQLLSGAGEETIISLLRGSKTWIAFACDASRTRAPAPVLRVAVHSASRGMSEVDTVTMPVSGKHTVTFTAKDVDFLSVVRSGGNAGDDVAVGYNYG